MPETHPPETRSASKSPSRWSVLQDAPNRRALLLVLALYSPSRWSGPWP